MVGKPTRFEIQVDRGNPCKAHRQSIQSNNNVKNVATNQNARKTFKKNGNRLLHEQHKTQKLENYDN